VRRDEAIDLMGALAIEVRFGNLDGSREAEIKEQKPINLAKHRRALKNNLTFVKGRLPTGKAGRKLCDKRRARQIFIT